MTERSNLSMMERAHCVINVRTHLETCKPDPPAEPPYMWRVSHRVRTNKKAFFIYIKTTSTRDCRGGGGEGGGGMKANRNRRVQPGLVTHLK